MEAQVGKHEPVAFQTAPSWVLVFPFSSAVRDKSLAQLRVRLEVLHRLKAANLEVACLVNSARTEVHVILSAGLVRLEVEAERAGLRKAVRCHGGLAPYSCKKRHLFGPLVLDEARFFTSGERQELILRIIQSNPRFAGAGIDLAALGGAYTAKTLTELPPGKLSSLAALLSGGEPQPMLTHRSADSREGLVATVLGHLSEGPFMLRMVPLHDTVAQEALAQAYAKWWLFAPPDIEHGPKSALIDVLHQSQSDPRAAAAVLARLPVVNALREYLGESHALYFLWLMQLNKELLPLVAVTVVLFAMHNSSSPLNIENAVVGVLGMLWLNFFCARWRRTMAHMQHKWGMTKASRDLAEISLRTACAQDREVERYQALTADNVRQRKATRRNRATLQLLVLACLALVSLGIYLLVRWSRATLFGSTPTPAQVLAMSVMDVGRIYLMQNIGREVLLYLSRWDDDISSTQDKAVWNISKHVFFDLCNNFCSIVVSVSYQSFSAGTDWTFVEPPSCFHTACQYDLELHIWTIVGIKYLIVPLIISAYNYAAFVRTRARLRRDRATQRYAPNAGNTRRSAAQTLPKSRASKPQASASSDPVTGAASTSLLGLLLGQGRRGASPSMTLEPDTDGLFGETPFEAQQQLRPYDAYVWELRRPLDLLMLITFAGTCTTLAPLLPLAALLFLLLKSRLDALELIVMTQRPPVNRERDVEVWSEALSWLGLVAVLATSIDIMFVTPDVEALIARLAASYRVFLVRDPAFSAGTTCVGGVCLDAGGTHKAEGSLYWIIWVEREVQSLLGLGSARETADDSSLVIEEYMARYNKARVDPNKFERPPY